MPDRETEIARERSAKRRGHLMLIVLIAGVLLAGVLLIGCSGSSGHRSSAASNGTSASRPKPVVYETYADIVAAVTACRQGVDTATWLSDVNKEQLYELCNKGLRRGLTEVKQYGLEACTEVTYTSPAKTAAEKSRVFAACYAGTKEKTAIIH